MKQPKKNQVVSVRMPLHIHHRYQSLAQVTNRSISHYINTALEASIGELEKTFLQHDNKAASKFTVKIEKSVLK
ncbi:hypothetical protein [Moraxella porci]|uniref:hypothetical protein n=1 Tax=Moraxella porci TaxID=1288392 RepID=UPI00244B56CA|nr:hypothetical protein [Moraxella porci]MDH2274232.1 hypothetical protein [Moraxella porci]